MTTLLVFYLAVQVSMTLSFHLAARRWTSYVMVLLTTGLSALLLAALELDLGAVFLLGVLALEMFTPPPLLGRRRR